MPDVSAASPRSPGPGILGRRLLPILLGAGVFCVMAALCVLNREVYYAIMLWWGFLPTPVPFWDTSAVLVAIDCHRAGVDVWQYNSCMNGGLYTYSPFLLRAAALPLGADMTIAVGVFLAAIFLLSQTLLPACRDWKETAIRCAAILSTAAVFAIERGNLDLALYAMAAGGTWLLLRARLRWLGYGAFVLAALLKFYPVTLLVLAARERPRVAVLTGAAAAAALVALAALSAGEMRTALGVTPVGWPFGDMFGALNIPYGVFVVPTLPASGGYGQEVFRASLSWPAKGLLAVLVFLAGCIVAAHLRRDRAAWQALDSRHAAYLVAGAVVIAGCFFAAQNVAYRAIFLLLTLPGLWLLMTSDRDGLGRYRPLIAAVLFVMWAELPRRMLERIGGPDSAAGIASLLVFWAIRELIWWWLVARLASLLAAFLLESPALAPLRALVPPRR